MRGLSLFNAIRILLMISCLMTIAAVVNRTSVEWSSSSAPQGLVREAHSDDSNPSLEELKSRQSALQSQMAADHEIYKQKSTANLFMIVSCLFMATTAATMAYLLRKQKTGAGMNR